MAAPTTVITVVKSFAYRNLSTEHWSNTYAFSGTTPADSAAWRTLFDALVAEEKKLYHLSTTVVGGYGYDGIPEAGDHAIWTVDMTVSPNSPVNGTLSTADGIKPAGDQAAWVRWGLDRYNTNGKRVYLRKYFHGGRVNSSDADQLGPLYSAALLAFGAKLRDGSFASARTIVDKNGAVPIGHGVSAYMTTRTLKRRGKRPPTGTG